LRGQNVGLECDLVDGLDDLWQCRRWNILISFIAALMACMSPAPASAAWRACRASSLALVAFSAFRLVMPDISSSEALVSSSEAACSAGALRERLAGCGNLRGGTGHLIRAAAQRPAERTQFSCSRYG